MPMPGYLPELFADPHLAVRPLRIRGPMKAPGNTGGARRALCRSPMAAGSPNRDIFKQAHVTSDCLMYDPMFNIGNFNPCVQGYFSD